MDRRIWHIHREALGNFSLLQIIRWVDEREMGGKAAERHLLFFCARSVRLLVFVAGRCSNAVTIF
jgi:ABC-type ATPase with predicted acetyltransferase domain